MTQKVLTDTAIKSKERNQERIRAMCDAHRQAVGEMRQRVIRDRVTKQPQGLVIAYRAAKVDYPQGEDKEHPWKPGRFYCANPAPGTIMIGFSRCNQKDEWDDDIGLWTAILHSVPLDQIPHLIRWSREINDFARSQPSLPVPPGNEERKSALRLNREGQPISANGQFPAGTPIIPPSIESDVLSMAAKAAERWKSNQVTVARVDPESGVGPNENWTKVVSGLFDQVVSTEDAIRRMENEMQKPAPDQPRASLRALKQFRKRRMRRLVVRIGNSDTLAEIRIPPPEVVCAIMERRKVAAKQSPV